MVSTELRDALLRLVRLGIGHTDTTDITIFPPLSDSDCGMLQDLAERQGLLAVVLDGVDCLPHSADSLPKRLRLEWIGRVLQNYEHRYELYRRTVGEMAQFYNSHGFRMMVLKGYVCSLDWPKPQHRPSGDIDIWLFGQYREADAILAAAKGTDVDDSHHHHTVFYWRNFMVENHYDFINIHHHKSNAEFEKILKKLGEDDSHSVELYGEKVYLPSPDLHALFLLKHTMSHFASEKISMRQILDWGFFVEKHGSEVDWKMVMSVLECFGMNELFGILNAICVEDLGFDAALFPVLKYDEVLKERVLNDILSPEFFGNTPLSLIPRAIFKYRRWRSNEWKHQLCYKDNMWCAFWSGVWGHLMKPSSI